MVLGKGLGFRVWGLGRVTRVQGSGFLYLEVEEDLASSLKWG